MNEGMPINKTNLWPFLSLVINSCLWLSKSIFDNAGNKTVPIAIAKIPIGNWINLSETYSQVGLPVTRSEAKIVSTNKFI